MFKGLFLKGMALETNALIARLQTHPEDVSSVRLMFQTLSIPFLALGPLDETVRERGDSDALNFILALPQYWADKRQLLILSKGARNEQRFQKKQGNIGMMLGVSLWANYCQSIASLPAPPESGRPSDIIKYRQSNAHQGFERVLSTIGISFRGSEAELLDPLFSGGL